MRMSIGSLAEVVTFVFLMIPCDAALSNSALSIFGRSPVVAVSSEGSPVSVVSGEGSSNQARGISWPMLTFGHALQDS
jgi:hypothetical protein